MVGGPAGLALLQSSELCSEYEFVLLSDGSAATQNRVPQPGHHRKRQSPFPTLQFQKVFGILCQGPISVTPPGQDVPMEHTALNEFSGGISSDAPETSIDIATLNPPASPTPPNHSQLLSGWAAIRMHTDDVSEWMPAHAREGLACLERLQRRIAAMQAALLCRIGLDRDSAAGVTRVTGASGRAARELVGLAQTISAVPEAGKMLERCEVSASQVRSVSGLRPSDARQLLETAPSMNDDDFAARVNRFKVDTHGPSRRARQRAMRSVTFFAGNDGCIGMRAVLPTLEGEELRGRLRALCDAQWTADHPVRSKQAGTGSTDTQAQRMADALMLLARGLVADTLNRHPAPSADEASNGPASGSDRGGSQSPPPGFGRPAVIVTIDAATLAATIQPNIPIGLEEALDVLARADVYSAITNGMDPAQLQFGRNRRVASALQRLALTVLQPTCVTDGCDVPAVDCHVHHRVEFEAGGTTDIHNLEHRCSRCHRHLHLVTRAGQPHRAVHKSGREPPQRSAS